MANEKALTPAGYGELLEDLKARIRTAQVKAALSVNRELIALYWHIGRSIVERQRAEGWGKAVVDRLANDLRREFPGMAGFSPRNIWYARSFYLAYETDAQKLQQPVAESDRSDLAPVARESDPIIPPQAVAEIPWGHNIVLFEQLKDPSVRLWYARQTVANGWSRAMLTH
jgi:predicted nuclease of restriction endonuclease-like (RecB) superfamily